MIRCGRCEHEAHVLRPGEAPRREKETHANGELMTKKGTGLTITFAGRRVTLTCRCGLTLEVAARDDIPRRCPRCRRAW